MLSIGLVVDRGIHVDQGVHGWMYEVQNTVFRSWMPVLLCRWYIFKRFDCEHHSLFDIVRKEGVG
jgi:hypothetical protein